MKVAELKARAKELGLKGFSKMKKAELETAIAEATKPAAPPPSVADLKRQARNKAKARRRALRKAGGQVGPG